MNAAVRDGLLGLVAAVALAGATPRSARGEIYLNGGILAEYNPSTGANPGNGAGEFDTYGTLNAPFTFNGQSNPILLTPGTNMFNLSHIYLSGYFGLGLFFTDTSTLLPTYPPLSPHLDVYPNPTPNSPSGFAFPNAGVLVQTLGYNTEPSPYSGATDYTLGNGDRVTVSSWQTSGTGDFVLTLFVDTAPPPPPPPTTRTWNGTGTQYNSAGSWTPTGVPAAIDMINFGPYTAPNSNYTVQLPAGGATVAGITLPVGNANSPTVTVNGPFADTPLNTGSLTFDSAEISLIINNTKLNVDSDVTPKKLTVGTGATLDMGSHILTGVQGTAVNINGGTVRTGNIVNPFVFHLNSGKVSITGEQDFFVGTGNDLLGPNPTFRAGKTLEVAGLLAVVSGSTFTLDGGALQAGYIGAGGGRGAFMFTSGTLGLTGGPGYTVGDSIGFGANNNAPTLDASKILEITYTTTIPASKSLTLSGGTLNTGALALTGGTFNFSSGTLGITGAGGLTIGAGGPLGSSVALYSNQTLNVLNNTPTANGLIVSAGAALQVFGQVNAAKMTNNGTLYLSGGSLATTGSATDAIKNAATGRAFVCSGCQAAVNGPMTNVAGGRITLQGNFAQLSGTGTLTNSGVITGDGELAKPLANAAGGEVRITAGQSILLSGASVTNAGNINVLGGSLDVNGPLTNSTTGRITGRGSYFFNGGMTNTGQLQFSGGNSDVYGNITLTGGASSNSKILNGAGGNIVSLYGNVVHNGATINTGTGSTTVFLGDVSGAGSFSGLGLTDFEGNYSPGNSPASVSLEGDMRLGGNNTLIMELAGATGGAEYDQLHVGGALSAGGALSVALLDGFTPVAGQAFDLFDWGTLTGQFASISLPSLAGGLTWNTSQLYTTGTISIGLPGDFSGNGIADAADYVTLRNAGGSGVAANYNVWRSNYGLGGSGSGSGAFSAIPEPVSATMAFFCAAALMLTTRHRLGRTETVSSVL